MTATPAPALTAAELARVQAFDAAEEPPEITEARATRLAPPHVGDIRGKRYVWNGSAWVDHSEAALVEAVRRVEAWLTELHAGDGAETPFCVECGHAMPCLTLREWDRIRATVAPQARDGAR